MMMNGSQFSPLVAFFCALCSKKLLLMAENHVLRDSIHDSRSSVLIHIPLTPLFHLNCRAGALGIAVYISFSFLNDTLI